MHSYVFGQNVASAASLRLSSNLEEVALCSDDELILKLYPSEVVTTTRGPSDPPQSISADANVCAPSRLILLSAPFRLSFMIPVTGMEFGGAEGGCSGGGGDGGGGGFGGGPGAPNSRILHSCGVP